MDNDNLHNELIQKVLLGDASEQEAKQLDELLVSDAGVKSLFNEMKKLYDVTEMDKSFYDKLDADKYYNKFIETTEGKEVIPISSESNSNYTFLKIAAAILISVGIGYQFLGSEEVVIVEMAVIETNTIEKTEEHLMDNSDVKLNINSKLTYPKSFSADKRIVELKGEAFFEIEPDSTKPFIVKAGNVRIKVLGTAFNVNANNPDSVVVTVKEGTVKVYLTRQDKGVILTANEKGTVLNTKNLTQANNDNMNYLYWYDGVLTFEDATLDKVVSTMNKVYGINITLANEALSSCRVTASYNNFEASKIFKLLEMTLGLTIEDQQEEIVITGEGC
ncbi:MAG: FecR domain-containing protein [Flavobacteriales bacterium]|nr:FecR domain-containing protein [Flavobacteriales bacterium]